MPRTLITPQKVVSTGLAVVTEAANVLGNSVQQSPDRWLQVTNGSGGSINVTVQTPGIVDGDLAVPDRVVAVPAAATRHIAVGNAAYRQPDGTVNIDYSAVASVTVACLELPA